MNAPLMDRTAEAMLRESSHLRRCARDLVALSALSALWAGRDAHHVAESLADVLLTMLCADLVYIRLAGLPEGIAIEAARAAGQPRIGSRAAEIGSALAGWLQLDGAGPAPAIPNPTGGGTLRLAVTPIRSQEEWGVAAVGAAHCEFPTEVDRLVLSLAANQAAVALQNARVEARYRDLGDELEQRVRERTAELTSTVQALDAEVAVREQAERASRAQAQTLIRTIEQLTQDHPLEEFPGIALAAIADQLGASSGALWAYDAVTEVAELVLSFEGGQVVRAESLPYPQMHKMSLPGGTPEGDGIKERFLRGECLLVTEPDMHPSIGPETRSFLAAKGIRKVLGVPMLLQGRLLGFYSLRSTRRESYGPGDFALAQALAHHATLAIQMARLAKQARQTAVLEERTRMAGEIHDGLGQAFTGILLQLGALELLLGDRPAQERALLESVRGLAREGLTEARRSAHGLRPQALEQMDLAAALQRMTEQLSTGRSTPIKFQLNGAPCPLPPDAADHLLRIGQEALTNALRHAQASEIGVELSFVGEELRLCVSDDGRGFATDTRLRKEGFGLTGIQERADIIGALLAVASQPGAGTRVELTWRFPPG